MANALYDYGRQAFLEGKIAYLTDTIKVALVGSGYVPNLAAHQFYSALASNPVGVPVALTSKTSTAGVAMAANVTFNNVPASTVTFIAMYKDTGNAGTSPLICLIDTANGLPITVPSGGNVDVNWDTGPNGIFKL